ncbi:HET-domain-containing protein [Thozetella sp. PMI_491]|nr:HET-domain-containing protein [Thozetella sp. PMI_491]
MAMASYRYRPLQAALQEIRLVHLLPGAIDDPIKIRIRHAPLPPPPEAKPTIPNRQIEALKEMLWEPWSIQETEAGEFIFYNQTSGERHPVPSDSTDAEGIEEYQPRYEALSYTWGDLGATEQAHVESGDQLQDERTATSAVLAIRPNLAAALRCFRHARDVRVLWIDAICINQEDIAERNEQVKRMTKIYSLASRVIAWLGEASEESKLALATLQHMGRQLEATKGGRVIAAPKAQEPTLWRNDHVLSFDQQTWQALDTFTERSWFYRTWCWQEISLGGLKTVIQCGNDTITWGDFWVAILCLYNKRYMHSVTFRERCRHIIFLKHNGSAHSITNILDVSRGKGCVNPRDKIYGLLGITPAYFSSGIVVDYKRSVEEVYREAFFAHLTVTKRLELLKHCDLSARQIGGPTWVPDWSVTEFKAPLLNEQLSSGMSRAYFTVVEPGVLEVLGKLQTTITRVSAAASKAEGQTLLSVRGWHECLPKTDLYVTGESMEVAFALTVGMNRALERYPYSTFLRAWEWVQTVRRILSLTADSEDDPLYSASETANTIQKVRGRCFFTTEDGHIGTAPAGARVGDSICLLLGTYSPVILRPTPSGAFQVVGECYVHGLQDAVGILGPLPEGWRAVIKGDEAGRPRPLFWHLATGQKTLEDPRLQPLPEKWDFVDEKRQPEDPAIFLKLKNLETGEIVNHDPRLSPEELIASGVDIRAFRLV